MSEDKPWLHDNLDTRAYAMRLAVLILDDWQGPTGGEADMRAGIIVSRAYLKLASTQAALVAALELIADHLDVVQEIARAALAAARLTPQ